MERISDYDYRLPDDLIAQEPLDDRSASRLLWLHRDTGVVEHRRFLDVRDILRPGDLLVANNTRVTAFRLHGYKPTGGQVEILALKNSAPLTYDCLARPGKRLSPGSQLEFEDGLTAQVVEELDHGLKRLKFNSAEALRSSTSAAKTVPLPPYITRQLKDAERYQTVYSDAPGSAAAPTAGLHFTQTLLEALTASGVQIAWVNLEVGLDTFRPVQVEDPSEHPIHGEMCEVPAETVRAVAEANGRIIAVGTTSVRTLETFAIGSRRLEAGRRESRLFIRPGYEFKIVDGMFTNFHMPRTTMMMMISALAGTAPVMAAYRQAVEQKYRFLSFGDSMLIL